MDEFGETPTIYVWPKDHVEGDPLPDDFLVAPLDRAARERLRRGASMTDKPTPGSAAGLTVMQAHRAADCPDRATCWAKDIHDAHDPAVTERYGVPDDPEATEHLRTQLVAITEAERKALYDASHFIAASSDLPGVQGLASAVLNVANRGGVNAD